MSENIVLPILLFIALPVLIGIALLVIGKYRAARRKMLALIAALLFIASPLLYWGLYALPAKEWYINSRGLQLEITQFAVDLDYPGYLEYGIGGIHVNITNLNKPSDKEYLSRIRIQNIAPEKDIPISFESGWRLEGANTTLKGIIRVAREDTFTCKFTASSSVDIKDHSLTKIVESHGHQSALMVTIRLLLPPP
jgi:hypothetical protein